MKSARIQVNGYIEKASGDEGSVLYKVCVRDNGAIASCRVAQEE